MEGMILAARAAKRVRNSAQTELHLSSLGGLHVTDASERDAGNVFQSTLRGSWRMRGLFVVVTGERLLSDRNGRARWNYDRWEGLGPTR